MKKLVSILCAFALVFSLAGCGQEEKKPEKKVTITITAAASLEKTFEETLIPRFEKKYPNVNVKGVYDSSGKLQIQIEQGLDADVFFSAATKQMDSLVDEKLVDSKSIVNLLENKLVLIKEKDTKTTVKGISNITDAKMIAVGDPEVVPAGQYAKIALTNANTWDAIQNKISLGGNVTEVLSWVESGSAEVGLVYSTDAASSSKVIVLEKVNNNLLDTPVIYPVGRVNKTKHQEQANNLIKFLQTKESKDTFKKSGFTICK